MQKRTEKQGFNFYLSDEAEQKKLQYKITLQKAKYLYFQEVIKQKKNIRKNSELLSNFNIFKIKHKSGNSVRSNSFNEKNSLKKLGQNIIKLFYDHPH